MSYLESAPRTIGDVSMTVVAWTGWIATAILAGSFVFSL